MSDRRTRRTRARSTSIAWRPALDRLRLSVGFQRLDFRERGFRPVGDLIVDRANVPDVAANRLDCGL
ncbi:hypothetical protein VB773_17600 [Haloarculaceae archaeon H-GB2-1]|nr:hypothetical protein [Haloarculaceae archaeon H-GB11]MEA5409205.1 hypothetical protein [Haloarculaceae archaeon H-GB2-1]